MKRIFKGTAIVALSSGLLFSSIPTSQFHSVQAKSTESIEQVLAKLSPEQRQALEKLQVSSQEGLQLSPSVDLESSDNLSVIVEFRDKPAKVAIIEEAANGNSLLLSDAEQKANSAQETFKSDLQTIYKVDLKQNNKLFKIKRTFKSTLNGVSIELPANKVKSLLESKVVKAVWPNNVIKVEPPTSTESSGDTKKVATEVFPGINKLHDEGFTGKGIKVGVIDTGIDYNHPDLTDAYKGYRAQQGVDPKTISPSSVKGWDFVDNDADPMETTYDDWKKSGLAEKNPSSGSTFYTEHGTHVSGIISGQGENNTDYAVTGVAPDADLYVYRVLGQYGSGSTESVLGGIDKSVADGMDVINLSLGSNSNDPENIESLAVNNAVLSGVTAVVAAGNAGNGMYTLGAPGASALAITVGANDTTQEIATSKATLHGIEEVSADLKLLGKGFNDKVDTLQGQNLPIVSIPNSGSPNDYNGKDVNGKIVLVNRGITALVDKVKEAQKHGAKAVIIANNVVGEGFIPSYLGAGYGMIPTFSVSKEKGSVIQNNLGSVNPTFSFDEMGQETVQGSKLASFSSRGPARMTYDIKPEVTAPGVSVFSTVPSYMHGADQVGNFQYAYDNLSGTSMATPNVAGVAALLLQANPNLTPAQIKETLMNTADPLNGDYSVYEVGAGQVDPFEAIHSKSRIEVVDETQGTLDKKGNLKTVKDLTGALAFGVFAPSGSNTSDQRSLTIYNNSNQAKIYDVNITYQTGRRGSLDADANGVMIVTDKSIKVAANSKKKSVVAITVPKSAALGTYEGYVTYTNHENSEETYQVPFAIKTVEEGINPVTMSPQAFTQVFDSAFPGQLVYTNAYFSIKSHMRTFDVILVDGKTNKELGFVGTMNGLGMSENVTYGVSKIFNGFYYKATGDEEQPFAYDQDLAKPGYYKLKIIGTNDAGRTFSQEAPFYFDNTAPKMTVNSPDVVEYKNGQSTVTITGSVYDNETEEMKSLGMNFNQGSTRVFYKDNLGGRDVSVPVNADGTFSVNIPTNPTRAMLPSFYAMDAASNKTFKEGRDIFVIRDDVAYGFMQPEKRTAKMGETAHATLTLNKVSNVKQVVYKFYHHTDVASMNVTPHPSVADKVNVNVEEKVYSVGSNLYEATVTVTLKDGATPLSGNLSLVDLGFTMSNTYTAQPVMWPAYIPSVTYTDINNTAKTALSGNPAIYFMEPTYSLARGINSAEAFTIYYGTPNQQANQSYDYSKMGIKIKATNSNGTVYNGVIPSGAGISVVYKMPNLPFTDDQYELTLDVPGHFTVHKNFTIGFHEDGKVTYQNLFLRPNPAIAGDVNKDDVIDVMDALYIQTYWGTNKREADINFDEKVDAKDLAFVEKNYLMQNPTINYAPTPKKKYKSQTLETVKRALGIQ
ncbi:S8 family serine peptidase [Paenisporosarcina sp. OV554]|uniref:S8 family serine peptidase n=1 Tax=Paenisporosarcina sp. OV554 TaxID=2135694 RepID=UPI000D3BFA4B|nr:S8 family serine peptidase [Paenisporosarcina sp. OV554]PUB08207.1 subtilisin family serine protease [Paenisporosarcina sp. OV554]